MADRGSGTRRRGLSLRWKLTLSYAAFTVVVGIVVIAVGLLVLRFVPDGNLVSFDGDVLPSRGDLLRVFVRYAAIGLAGLAALGLAGGWLIAGRTLRRLRLVTAAAERVRSGDLDHRIRMPGAADELSTLADTFDGMVSRVQASMDEHRRFAANASHELRTPNAVIRTMVEVARADPNRDVDRLLDRIEATNERSIALTEALLSLARSEQIDASAPVDLRDLAQTATDELRDLATRRGVTVDHDLDAARVLGEPALLAQLVTNLVQNGIVHNAPGGRVWISTRTDAARTAVLEVASTGRVVDDAEARTLLEPFTRATGRTHGTDPDHAGLGLGLALVAAIVRAHAGRIELLPRDGGGLTARVTLPSA